MIFHSSHERARGHATNTISAKVFFMEVSGFMCLNDHLQPELRDPRS